MHYVLVHAISNAKWNNMLIFPKKQMNQIDTDQLPSDFSYSIYGNEYGVIF